MRLKGKAGLYFTAILCGVSMWRVDWEQEAVEARKQSIAVQAERLLPGSACDVSDVENSLDGGPQGSLLPGGGQLQDPALVYAIAALRCSAVQGRAM